MTVRFGAMAIMRDLRYSKSCARYWVISITSSHSALMLLTSSSATSVPMDTMAVALSSSSTCSSRMSEKSRSLARERTPILSTHLAYCMLSVTILTISGKCQPYHSLTRIAYVLISLSSSSSSPMACTIMVSTLSGLNLSLYRPKLCARPRYMAFSWLSPRPVTSVASWARIPRMTSIAASVVDTFKLSFFLMTAASLESATASVSAMSLETTFFLRNFLRPLSMEDSTDAVAAASASVVSLNLENAWSLTIEVAFSGDSNSLAMFSTRLNFPSSRTLNSA
mmetsp:Transcript_3248/g.10173  ORF Transcript_3248/g.10173 Transcript_3248/m.10173 type:complete len:281 (+) Transcript_3248:1034-1876(+)